MRFKTIVKWVVFALLVAFCVEKILEFVYPDVTDVTPYVTMSKFDMERNLAISFSASPDMEKKIYHCTNGRITVDGNDKGSLGIIYIDGIQSGFHIDDRMYSMFGIRIGDDMEVVNGKMTYDYEEQSLLANDLMQHTSTAVFYYNYTRGDCLIVVANDTSNRVVALTYFSRGKKATELINQKF